MSFNIVTAADSSCCQGSCGSCSYILHTYYISYCQLLCSLALVYSSLPPAVVPIDDIQQNGTDPVIIVSWTRHAASMDIMYYRVYFNTTERVGAGGNITAPSSASQVVLSTLLVGVRYQLQLVVIVEGKNRMMLEGGRSPEFPFTIPIPGWCPVSTHGD